MTPFWVAVREIAARRSRIPPERRAMSAVREMLDDREYWSYGILMNTARETDGKYTYPSARPCVCGHTFGQHTAYKSARGRHECCEDCACEGFAPTRSSR